MVCRSINAETVIRDHDDDESEDEGDRDSDDEDFIVNEDEEDDDDDEGGESEEEDGDDGNEQIDMDNGKHMLQQVGLEALKRRGPEAPAARVQESSLV
jgi:hypothetical protein